jgi:hypothetical protein
MDNEKNNITSLASLECIPCKLNAGDTPTFALDHANIFKKFTFGD